MITIPEPKRFGRALRLCHRVAQAVVFMDQRQARIRVLRMYNQPLRFKIRAWHTCSAKNQRLPCLRFRDHHHQFRCSAGKCGLRACAAAHRSVSSTQTSCFVPAFSHSRRYRSSPSEDASCVTFAMPRRCRSRSIDGPTPERSRSRRVPVEME